MKFIFTLILTLAFFICEGQPVQLIELSSNNAKVSPIKDDLLIVEGDRLVRFSPETGTSSVLAEERGLSLKGVLKGRYVYFSSISKRSFDLYCYDNYKGSCLKLKTFRSLDNFVAQGGDMFFIADDGEVGRELWRSSKGRYPQLVADLIPGQEDGFDRSNGLLVSSDKHVYFKTKDNRLWKSNGRNRGTKILACFNEYGLNARIGTLGVLGSKLYFSIEGYNRKNYFRELWTSDEKSNGAMKVKTIDDFSNIGVIDCYTKGHDGYVYFFHYYDYHSELWKTNGTAKGTEKIKTLGEGVPFELSVVNDKLVFYTLTEASVFDIWVSDGTGQGTTVLQSLQNVPRSSIPLAVSGDRFWYVDDGKLWEADPFAKNINALDGKFAAFSDISNIKILFPHKHELYFTGETSAGNLFLYVYKPK
ncbi:hypothetical protein RCC89_16155 [Cytophagaceae bacterium ABcell3]|nr:hypothetical protein RCC89_16155 [Cytophagaceae bacterium ABcell3]